MRAGVRLECATLTQTSLSWPFCSDGKVAHAANAARVDAHPPLDELMEVQEELFGKKAKKQGKGEEGKSVVYWMRMEDVRGECILNPLLQMTYSCWLVMPPLSH